MSERFIHALHLVLLGFFSLQQLTMTEVKVDKVQVSGAGNTTFAVCLDQDEKKILQSVTRCGIKKNTWTYVFPLT